MQDVLILIAATFVNAFGNGAYLTSGVLFLTRVAGLSPAAMSAGLSIGAAAGMVSMTPLGYVADRYGPKRLLIGAMLVLAGAYTMLLTVHTLPAFAGLSCVMAVAMALTKGANGALVAGSVPPEQRLRSRAVLRSTTNAGIGLGTLVGSVPLLLHSSRAYAVVLLANAASFLIAAVILGRARGVPPQARPAEGPRLIALRDRSFLAFAALDGLLTSIFNEVIAIGLPLWLAARTHAPLWLISVALVINTAGCVLLQVRATRNVDGATAGARASQQGAAVIALACAVFGLTGGLPSVVVGALVVVAAVIHVLGELRMSTGSWAILFGLAPDTAQGQYQGTYFAGRQVGDTVAPPLITTCVLGLHSAGWFLLAAVFLVGGLAYRPLIRRTRPSASPAGVAGWAGG